MAKFRELVAKLEAGKVHKLTWLCGDQPVLAEEAITAIRLTLDAEEMNTTTLFAEPKKPNGAIWTEMSQHALDSTQKRLVVVRDAEKLGKSLTKLEPWIAGTKYANVYVVMQSNLPEWKSDYLPEVRKKVVGSSTSLYVELRLPKGDPHTEAAAIAAECWSPHLDKNLAEYLAERTGCDLARMRDVCTWINGLKASRPKWKLSEKSIDALTTATPSEGFVVALTKMDKVAAMNYAVTMSDADVRDALYKLAKNLSWLESMNRTMRPVLQKVGSGFAERPQAIREVAGAVKIPINEAKWMWDYAKHYDASSVSRRTEVLIKADSHKNELGVLETLVTGW